MAKSNVASQLSDLIKELEAQRREHQREIERIDSVFAQYGIRPGSAPRRGAVKAGAAAPVLKKTRKAGKRRGKGKGRRGVFGETAEQFVVNLLQDGKTLSTSEINQAWKGEGRGGSADNTLTRLTKNRMIKRSKNKEGRGSSYSAM